MLEKRCNLVAVVSPFTHFYSNNRYLNSLLVIVSFWRGVHSRGKGSGKRSDGQTPGPSSLRELLWLAISTVPADVGNF